MDKAMEGVEDDKLKGINVEKMMEFLQTKNVYRCTYPGCKTYFDRPYRLAQHILAHNNIVSSVTVCYIVDVDRHEAIERSVFS